MKKRTFALIFALGVSGVIAAGQQLDLSSLDKLTSKAKESSNITLDPEGMKLAAGFLEGNDKKVEGLGEMANKVSSMTIRSLEFDGPGGYSNADVEPIRKQLSAPGWTRVVDIKDKDESFGIWFFRNDKTSGMAMLAQEPRELTVINLVGTADLAALGKLGKLVKIPEIRTGFDKAGKKPSTTGSGSKKDEEEEEDERK